MGGVKTSGRRLISAQRRAQALELRKAGATYRQIGEALGISEQRAHKIVTEELQRLSEQRAEAADEVRRLEEERLDALLVRAWRVAATGNLQAIDRVLKIMERRARLRGLDAPLRVAGDIALGDGIERLLEDPEASELLDALFEKLAGGPGGSGRPEASGGAGVAGVGAPVESGASPDAAESEAPGGLAGEAAEADGSDASASRQE